MKSLTFNVNIQIDAPPNGTELDMQMIIEAINDALYRSNLTCQPQILPESVVLGSKEVVKMETVLNKIVDTFPEFDTDEEMNGSDTIEALGVLWNEIKESIGAPQISSFEVELFGDTYTFRPFTDVDPDRSGIEIFENGDRIGSMVRDLPDETDEIEVRKFKQDLEDWIVENYL